MTLSSVLSGKCLRYALRARDGAIATPKVCKCAGERKGGRETEQYCNFSIFSFICYVHIEQWLITYRLLCNHFSSWVYTNLALEQQRQLGFKCPDDKDHTPQLALLRKNQVVTTLLTLAVDVDPGNSDGWMHLSSLYHRAGDSAKTMDALERGTEFGREDANLVNIWNQLGIYLQDGKQWKRALHAHQRGLYFAQKVDADSLHSISHTTYLAAYLCEWDEEKKQRRKLLRALDAHVVQHAVPPLHPWMSLCMPMPHSLRLKVAGIMHKTIVGYLEQRYGMRGIVFTGSTVEINENFGAALAIEPSDRMAYFSNAPFGIGPLDTESHSKKTAQHFGLTLFYTSAPTPTPLVLQLSSGKSTSTLKDETQLLLQLPHPQNCRRFPRSAMSMEGKRKKNIRAGVTAEAAIVPCDGPPKQWGRRIRVGFASADFKDKATLYLVFDIFRHLDCSLLEVFVYSTQPDELLVPSEWRRHVQATVEHFVDLSDMDVPEASARVAADRLDILVDMDGYSNEGLRKSELFSIRHAVVTVAWFVYMSTTGNPEIDYIVADPVVLPEAIADKGHVSKVLYMPTTFFPNCHRRMFPVRKPSRPSSKFSDDDDDYEEEEEEEEEYDDDEEYTDSEIEEANYSAHYSGNKLSWSGHFSRIENEYDQDPKVAEAISRRETALSPSQQSTLLPARRYDSYPSTSPSHNSMPTVHYAIQTTLSREKDNPAGSVSSGRDDEYESIVSEKRNSQTGSILDDFGHLLSSDEDDSVEVDIEGIGADEEQRHDDSNMNANFWDREQAKDASADYGFNSELSSGDEPLDTSNSHKRHDLMCLGGLRMLHDMSEGSCENYGLLPLLSGQITRRSLGLPSRKSGAFVFACFTKHVKIRRELFDVWARALVRLPHAYLWLLKYPVETEETIRKYIRDTYGNTNVNQRVVFADFLTESDDNFARLAVGADAVLDTTVYGGHTTSIDALWAALPLVTCVGDCVSIEDPPEYGNQMASRVAASMLHSLGLEEELVAINLDEYEEIMVSLAQIAPADAKAAGKTALLEMKEIEETKKESHLGDNIDDTFNKDGDDDDDDNADTDADEDNRDNHNNYKGRKSSAKLIHIDTRHEVDSSKHNYEKKEQDEDSVEELDLANLTLQVRTYRNEWLRRLRRRLRELRHSADMWRPHVYGRRFTEALVGAFELQLRRSRGASPASSSSSSSSSSSASSFFSNFIVTENSKVNGILPHSKSHLYIAGADTGSRQHELSSRHEEPSKRERKQRKRQRRHATGEKTSGRSGSSSGFDSIMSSNDHLTSSSKMKTAEYSNEGKDQPLGTSKIPTRKEVLSMSIRELRGLANEAGLRDRLKSVVEKSEMQAVGLEARLVLKERIRSMPAGTVNNFAVGNGDRKGDQEYDTTTPTSSSDFGGLPEYCLRARDNYDSTSASSQFEAHSSVSSSTPEESILPTRSSLSIPSVESTAASQFHTSGESSVFGGGSESLLRSLGLGADSGDGVGSSFAKGSVITYPQSIKTSDQLFERMDGVSTQPSSMSQTAQSPKPVASSSKSGSTPAASTSSSTSSSELILPVIGLMITRNDESVLREWLEANMRFLDGLVILDGSPSSSSRIIIENFQAVCQDRARDIHYMHEIDKEATSRLTLDAITGLPRTQEQLDNGRQSVLVKNDQTLRAVVHEKVRELYGHGRWIVLCHSDEFFYHDPRRVAGLASLAGADHVFWYALHVLPHPSEKFRYESEKTRSSLVQTRFQHFHHNYRNKGFPWMEVRKETPLLLLLLQHVINFSFRAIITNVI